MSSRKENAAQMLAHQDGESGQLSFGEARLPEKYSITARPGAQGLAALLRIGAENAVMVWQIAELWGFDLQQMTQALGLEWEKQQEAKDD